MKDLNKTLNQYDTSGHEGVTHAFDLLQEKVHSFYYFFLLLLSQHATHLICTHHVTMHSPICTRWLGSGRLIALFTVSFSYLHNNLQSNIEAKQFQALKLQNVVMFALIVYCCCTSLIYCAHNSCF